MSDFVELRLKLIDLPNDVTETSDLGVGGSHRSACARGLVDGGDLGLSRELQREDRVSIDPLIGKCMQDTEIEEFGCRLHV